MRNKKRARSIIMLLLMVMFIQTFQVGAQAASSTAGSASEASVNMDANTNTGEENLAISSIKSYGDYLARYKGADTPDHQITVSAADYTNASGMVEKLDDYQGSSDTVLKTSEDASVEWNVEVPQDGLYHLSIAYFPVEGKSSAIERELWLNGEIPFNEAKDLLFSRVWANEKPISQDNRGNEVRPRQVESPQWIESEFKDTDGYYNEPYEFYLKKGTNTIRFVSVREPLILRALIIKGVVEIPEYSKVLQDYKAASYPNTTGLMIKIQGEDAVSKSDPTLYPLYDRSSPLTEPYNRSKIRINTIGGYNWRMPGQWIEWEFDVPEDGLYQIAIKNRQNILRGIFCSRKLYIDGKIPFAEMSKIPFNYDGDWQMKVLGQNDKTDTPYRFYLTKGTHRLKMEVTLGDTAELLTKVEKNVLDLNSIYRKIMMITGSVPDPNRDYQIAKQLPDLSKQLIQQSEMLADVSERLEQITGERGSQTALLTKMAVQMKVMAENIESVPKRLLDFKTNIGGLGTWILQVREQPLEIDYMVVSSSDRELPKVKLGFFAKLWHELIMFFVSFFADYNVIGDVADADDSITVWIGTGRDQAQVLKSMIDDTFIPQTGIKVNLKLVDMNVLLPATVSDEGPDVALQLSKGIPINFAFRDAAQDLNQFADLDEVATRFNESAIMPYRFQGGVFALPEQESFDMLFYRKDIFAELGLNVPQTWDEVYSIIQELQKRHMEFALPSPVQIAGDLTVYPPNPTFAMLNYQMDGEFYHGDGESSALDSEQSMKAFEAWTDLYSSYRIPVEFDFPNRFRTGEMPIGIADYTFYNHLYVSAPEIRGLWGFVPVPGIRGKDGTIHREVSSNGVAAMMLKNSKNKDNAWTFMKWWTSKDIQVRFGREMESILGASARYPTANIKALEELPWPVDDYHNLMEQWKWVRGIPEVPGGYFTGRHLDNAFRKVLFAGSNPRETLLDYLMTINEEIRLKRKEFGLQ